MSIMVSTMSQQCFICREQISCLWYDSLQPCSICKYRLHKKCWSYIRHDNKCLICFGHINNNNKPSIIIGAFLCIVCMGYVATLVLDMYVSNILGFGVGAYGLFNYPHLLVTLCLINVLRFCTTCFISIVYYY